MQSSGVVRYGLGLWNKIISWLEHFEQGQMPPQDVFPEYVCLFADGTFLGTWGKTGTKAQPICSFYIFLLFCYLSKSLFIYRRASWTWVFSRHWFFFLPFNPRQLCFLSFLPPPFNRFCKKFIPKLQNKL